MQIASILSDLTSLRVCVSPCPHPALHPNPCNVYLTSAQGHSSALALVSVHKSHPSDPSDPITDASTNSTSVSAEEAEDADLQRARDLIDLHYGVKAKYQSSGGVDKELEGLRAAVGGVMGDMERKKGPR